MSNCRRSSRPQRAGCRTGPNSPDAQRGNTAGYLEPRRTASTPTTMAAHWLTLVAALAYTVVPLASAAECSKEFTTADDFETEVMDDDKVWAIVFHSAKKGALSTHRCLSCARDAATARQGCATPPGQPCRVCCARPLSLCPDAALLLDPEGLGDAANGLMAELEGKVKVGCFDYKVSKDLAGEFGVRKFNLPQIRIFVSRARSPSKVSMKHEEEDALLYVCGALLAPIYIHDVFSPLGRRVGWPANALCVCVQTSC